jgi:hypothetical protein
MNALAQIVEMDQERDRKTCVTLDLKVNGANRELAQWCLDHPRYSHADIARWLGCNESRIRRLRKWAAGGFVDFPNTSYDKNRNPVGPPDSSLKTNDNSESDDDFDPETGEVKDEVAAPEVLEDNILHAIGGMNENARVFNKLLKVSALDREAVARINTAIDRMMGKWRSIQSTLEKKE